jgi:peptidoglycan hydrolase-like protein with peptidoglycan-binding domain
MRLLINQKKIADYLRYFCSLLAMLILSFAVITDSAYARKHRRQLKTDQPELSSAQVREVEERLGELGYWTGPIDGIIDAGTIHALIAFQKVNGHKPTGKLTTAELQAIRSAVRPLPQEGGYPHVEVDLSRQVLFMVAEHGLITKILPISSGSNKLYQQDGVWYRAHTPRGRFMVYRKINGWRRSPLGLLYYPNYLVNGIAIHGNPSVPVYPASHGCIRIPMFASKEFSELTPVGTIIYVFDKNLLLANPAHNSN